MLVENVSLWCKRLSKKVKIQNKKRHKETQTEEKKGHRRPPVTLTFPVFSSTEDVPVSTSVSLHVHKQKYIHSSHFGTFFFFFFVHKNYKKLQKAPLNRPVVTLAAVQLANPPRAGHLHKTVISYISSKYRCVIHSSAYDAALIPTWSQKQWALTSSTSF